MTRAKPPTRLLAVAGLVWFASGCGSYQRATVDAALVGTGALATGGGTAAAFCMERSWRECRQPATVSLVIAGCTALGAAARAFLDVAPPPPGYEKLP